MKIKLNKNEYTVETPKLRKWIELEDIRLKLEIATDDRTFLEHYFGLVSVAIHVSVDELEELPWIEVADAYIAVVSHQKPTLDFPMLKVNPKRNTEDWKYDGRNWYVWSHLLASTYGWTLEYIAEMNINDAIGLMHEIVSTEFMEKEWEWGLSEIAYPYDPNSKKSSYKPLPRPEWMEATIMERKVTATKKVRIRREMLPRGMTLSWSKKDDENVEYIESSTTI